MHLSLKGSLIRSPMLNRVGQRLLQLFEGASAAYSLRDLASNIASVVRVRRASDNSEKDFSAADVSSGAMTQWVGSGNDGFVETWYDQSGNGNDAVQETAGSQPKIVAAGVLVSGGIDFDGVDDYLQTTNSDLCNVDELSVFSVLKPHIAASQAVAFSCGSVVAGSTSYGGWKLNLNGYVNQAQFQTQALGSGSATTLSNSVGGNDTLVSYVADFPDASTFANGQAGLSSSSTISPNNSNSFRRLFRIGCHFTFQVNAFYTQPIKELILYTSDQSANRAAIETNINNQYDIY